MSALLVRRVSWLVVLCGVLYVGSLAGIVRSQDSELENTKPAPAATVPPIPAEGEGEEGGNAALQAVGGLGIGHIQSTLGLIGVTADAFAKETYDAKKVEGLMTSTINSIDVVKKLLRKLQDTKLSPNDEDFIDRMMGAYNALQREAKALSTFARSRKPADAEAFAKARKTAIDKIDKLTVDDDATTAADPPAGN
ncbi:MAG: hypothetical protein H7062_15695 [Candidatus Saccharimonas sp.]|nr:hypothetical protein [Planctomycetaceae bacterium]